MKPTVDIVVATYNQENFVWEAVESAVNQNYENLTVVVSDDGSTDRTPEILKELKDKYSSRLHILVDQPRLGVTGNCNRFLSASTAEFIAFHAGDDILLPGKIEKQIDWFLENKDGVLCGHDVEVFHSETGEKLYNYSEKTPMISGTGAEKFVEHKAIFCGVSVMMKSSSLPTYGYDESIKYSSDWLLWIEGLSSGGVFGYTPEILARYRRHDRSITVMHPTEILEEDWDVLSLVREKYPHLRASVKRREARTLCVSGLESLIQGDGSSARGYFLRSVKKMGRMKILLKSLAGLLLSILPVKLAKLIVSYR